MKYDNVIEIKRVDGKIVRKTSGAQPIEETPYIPYVPLYRPGNYVQERKSNFWANVSGFAEGFFMTTLAFNLLDMISGKTGGTAIVPIFIQKKDE